MTIQLPGLTFGLKADCTAQNKKPSGYNYKPIQNTIIFVLPSSSSWPSIIFDSNFTTFLSSPHFCLTTLSQSWPPIFLFLLQFVIFLSVVHPVPPDVTEDPQNITETNLLSTFNLTCLASENPLYQWYRDGNLIYNDTKPILTITEALPEDRGFYTCVAVNEAGTSSSQPGLVIIPGKT